MIPDSPQADLFRDSPVLVPIPVDFDGAINEGRVLVVFWSRFCRGCVELLQALESYVPGQNGILRVLIADMARHEALGDRFRVLTLPTMLFFQHGQLLSVKVGPQDAEGLRDWLNPFLASS